MVLLCCLAVVPAHAKEALPDCLAVAMRHPQEPIDVSKNCPALFGQWQAQQLPGVFESGQATQMTVPQLEFLAASQLYRRTVPQVQTQELNQLLAGILKPEPEDDKFKWWHAFLNWLDSLKSGHYEAEYQWLSHLLQAITPSEQTIAYFFYGIIALLIIVSIALLLHELWLAEFFQKWRGGQRRRPIQAHPPQAMGVMSPRPVNLDGLSATAQIAALLERVLDKLAGCGMIPNDASLTYRQQLNHFKANARHPSLAYLVQTAEPILYGRQAVEAQLLGAYRRTAQDLLDKDSG